MQLELDQITSSGAQLIAISPQLPDQSLVLQEEEHLDFHMLYDAQNRVAKAFGLVFALPQALRPVYAEFGINLPVANGDDTFELPVPATYVVDKNSRIILDFMDVNHTIRLEPSRIVESLLTIAVL